MPFGLERRPASHALLSALVSVALVLSAAGCADKPTEHRMRANAYLNAGEADKALGEVDRGLQAASGDVPLLVLRGKVLFELDRFEQARAAYRAALEAAPDARAPVLNEAHLGLAMIATRQQRWRDARTHFAELVARAPDSASAHLNLARVCLHLEQLDCAIEHGERAAKLRGSSEEALFTLGRIYLTAGRHSEAEKTFLHICEVADRSAACPYGVALVAAKRGDKARALRKLHEAVQPLGASVS